MIDALSVLSNIVGQVGGRVACPAGSHFTDHYVLKSPCCSNAAHRANASYHNLDIRRRTQVVHLNDRRSPWVVAIETNRTARLRMQQNGDGLDTRELVHLQSPAGKVEAPCAK